MHPVCMHSVAKRVVTVGPKANCMKSTCAMSVKKASLGYMKKSETIAQALSVL